MYQISAAFGLFFSFASGATLSANSVSSTEHLHRRCGTVSQFYNPKPADWQSNNVDTWLNNWISSHQSDISAAQNGFAGAFGQWSMGNPDWSCRDDGSSTNCDVDVCDNRVLNDRGDDIRPAYYVLEAVKNLHTYFVGMGQSFEVSGIATSMKKDKWATTFHLNKDDSKKVTLLKEVFNLVKTVVGVATAFAGPPGAVANSLVSGVFGIADPYVKEHKDDPFQRSADLGDILGNIFIDTIKKFISNNNELMHGSTVSGGDIKSYLSGGGFVNYQGVDKVKVIDNLNALLLGNAAGGKCGDGQGIGNGPANGTVCRDDKAWYIYFWQENDVVSTTSHQWGWVVSPPGAEMLDKSSDYPGVTVEDVINSSLDAYNAAGYNYDATKAADRAQAALSGGWANPGSKAASWEGTFTIPVCDVGAAVNSNYEYKEFILQDYGHDSRPLWCGPICSGDLQKTQDFIKAARMEGFASPKHQCSTDPGY